MRAASHAKHKPKAGGDEWQNNTEDNNDDDYDKLIGRVKSRDNRPLVVRLEDTLRVEHVLFKTKGYSAWFLKSTNIYQNHEYQISNVNDTSTWLSISDWIITNKS